MKRAVVTAMAAVTLFGGDLEDRYKLTLDRVQGGGPPRYDAPMILADVEPKHVRRFTEYSGDVSGRYLSALVFAVSRRNASATELSAITKQILAMQKPDGHFGEPLEPGAAITQNSMAMLWGNGRLLVGLLETYRVQPMLVTLNGARKLGDWLLSLAPVLNSDAVRKEFNDGKFASGYICWTQNTEGLALLFEATKDKKYLDAAASIAAVLERRPGQHSHGYLTSLRGILELHRLSGDAKYLAQVEREWSGLVESGNVMPHGAIPEMLRPENYRDEGCSEGDWMRLNLGLWKATGKPLYLEQAEHALFNEFALNQFRSGDFGHRPFSARGVGTANTKGGGLARAWWCCTLHGLRSMEDVFGSALRTSNGELHFDLPVDGKGAAPGLSVQSLGVLSREGAAELKVTFSDGKPRAIVVRVPKWASCIEATLNDQRVDTAPARGELRFQRAWASGDRLRLRYILRVRMAPAEQYGGQKGLVTFFYGPWMLGVDEESSPAFFDEPSDSNRLLLAAGENGEVELASAPNSGPKEFGVPWARFEVKYEPGGYAMQPGAAVLRPLAEQTGEATSSWEMQFRLK